MKRLNFFLITLFLTPPLYADRRGDQGLGIMLGNPTGLSAKFWMDDLWAIDGAIGIDRSEFDVHLTILRHDFIWVNRIGNKWGWFQRLTTEGDLPYYFGAGPRILFEDKEEIGIRFPVGLSYLPHQSPWEIFLEVAPVFRLTPSTGFNGDFSVGVRYYFQAIRPRVGGVNP